MYLMNIPQEEENELDALQSAKELEEEKKKEKERQAKLVCISKFFNIISHIFKMSHHHYILG